MQQTIRTTIRIRKDLLDQARRIALEHGTSVQEVVNDILTKGFHEVTDLSSHQHAMQTIKNLQKRLKNQTFNTLALADNNKKELEKRTDWLIPKKTTK